MKKVYGVFIVLAFLGISVTPATALSILQDWAFYIDGDVYEYWMGDSMPVDGSLDNDGMGTLTWSSDVQGDHTIIAFFDFEISEASNTFFNEFADYSGTPMAEQMWEMDEPFWGDIYYNAIDGQLDNTNEVPQGFEDDVSFALGWSFTLLENEEATISYVLSDILPDTGFYLSQTDVNSLESIYFTSTLSVDSANVPGPSPAPVPEPSTLILFATGCVFIGRKMSKK